MKKLSQLHEAFMDSARRPMSFGKLPVMPKETDVPILPSNKWIKKEDFISKRYDFMSKELRNEFVMELFEYEESVGHHAKMLIDENGVTLTLQTKDIKHVTELDKEYANFSDVTYKDVVYRKSEKNFIDSNLRKIIQV